MAVWITSGATRLTILCATDAFVFWRDWISPAIRCEKNSIGSRSTFQMYEVLPTAAIFPSRRKE